MTLITGYENTKVGDYLRKQKPRKVCLVFWHGLGDLVMFITTFWHLRKMFPEIQIDIALQEGTGQEALIRDAVLIRTPDKPIAGYDYTFQIHYPMSEHMKGRWTKNEWCCKTELGIDPIDSYPVFKKRTGLATIRGKYLVALHFQATALPGMCNPTEEVAHDIWADVIESGFVPIEAFFKHAWYNPVNEKFKFVPGNQTARKYPATIPRLIKLLQSCYASICVASGNLPMSLAIMPERTLYLEKDFSINSYSKMNISSVNVDKYPNRAVKAWLEKL